MAALCACLMILLSACQTVKPLRLSPSNVDLVLAADNKLYLEKKWIYLSTLRNELNAHAVGDNSPIKIHYHSNSSGDALRQLASKLEELGYTFLRFVEYTD